MKALVLDGYTDEPACLGVPPYVSPYARLAYGALTVAGADATYATIDQWRSTQTDIGRFDLIAVIRNVAVPGRYLRGMPASDRELERIGKSFAGRKILSIGIDPKRAPLALTDSYDHVCGADFDASLYELVKNGEFVDRRRTNSEWNNWLVKGVLACKSHPDFGGPLIAEVQMYRGCVRYITGGCRFCIEPLFGDVLFRKPADIIREVGALAEVGVSNLRLGAQSCVYCYMSEETGKTETPRPNVGAISSLLRGIKETAKPDVFHLDNANPAVIAEHPIEAREVTKAIAENCTSGNVLAFGLESADPKVQKENNLNATPEQTLEAIRLVNEIGDARGPSGLPLVLPGLNFVCGLNGESKETYQLNLDFLKKIVEAGLLLRRINIRQVIPSREEFPGTSSRAEFRKFKTAVRNDIDKAMLDVLVPNGTVIRNVYTELVDGGTTFGRQVGSYPLLVGIPYKLPLGLKVDVAVTDRGFRSVTGILHPTDANTATLSMLQAVPGIGRKRAMAIVRGRPFTAKEQLWRLFDEEKALSSAQFHLTCGNVDKPQ